MMNRGLTRHDDKTYKDDIFIIIRTQFKKIDEMRFKCPQKWTLYQLKYFVYMHHKQSSEYLKPDKCLIIYAGKIWNDNTKLSELPRINESIFTKKLDTLILILKYKSNKGSTQTSQQDSTTNIVNEPSIPTKTIEMDKYIQKCLYNDYYTNVTSRIDDHLDKFRTNIPNTNLLHILPLFEENLGKDIIKRVEEMKHIGNLNNGMQQPQQQERNNINNNLNNNINNNNQDEETEELDNLYKFKLLVKLSIFFLVFSTYFKGFYFYFFIIILTFYYWLKVKDNRIKLRNQNNDNNQVNNHNIDPNQNNNLQDQGQNINERLQPQPQQPQQPQQQHQQQQQNINQVNEIPLQQQQQQQDNVNIPPNENDELMWLEENRMIDRDLIEFRKYFEKNRTKIYYLRVKEFLLCFASSLFPTWTLEIYMDSLELSISQYAFMKTEMEKLLAQKENLKSDRQKRAQYQKAQSDTLKEENKSINLETASLIVNENEGGEILFENKTSGVQNGNE